MEETKEREAEIRIKDLFVVFAKVWWILLLVGIVVCGGLYMILKMTHVDQYTATASVYINRPSGTLQAQQVSIANALVNDYIQLVTMDSTLGEVQKAVCNALKESGLDATGMEALSTQTFRSMVSVKSNSENRWVELSVTAEDEMDAVVLADALAKISVEMFNGDRLVGETYSKYYGTLDASKVNPSLPGSYAPITNPISKMRILLIGAAVCLVVYLVFLFLYVMDDKINKPEDVEKYLGLNLLGEIPYSHGNRKGGEYYAAKTTRKGGKA